MGARLTDSMPLGSQAETTQSTDPSSRRGGEGTRRDGHELGDTDQVALGECDHCRRCNPGRARRAPNLQRRMRGAPLCCRDPAEVECERRNSAAVIRLRQGRIPRSLSREGRTVLRQRCPGIGEAVGVMLPATFGMTERGATARSVAAMTRDPDAAGTPKARSGGGWVIGIETRAAFALHCGCLPGRCRLSAFWCARNPRAKVISKRGTFSCVSSRASSLGPPCRSV